MISPTTCAPNSELASDSGIVDDLATGFPGPALAWLPGAGLGAEDGLIFGKRLDALPAGIVVELPGTPVPTTGRGPIGRLLPRLKAEPAAPPAEPPPGPAVGVDRVPPAFRAVPVLLGDGEAGGLATVTVALPAVVSDEPPSDTETPTVYVILSPAGAVLGTLTWTSICGAAGWPAGRDSTQLVAFTWLAQLSTVNTGALSAGLFALGVRVVAIVAFSAEVDQAEILKRTVPPA